MTAMAPVDLSDTEQARAWIEEAAAVHGRMDVLYNNASAARFGPIADLAIEGAAHGIRAVAISLGPIETPEPPSSSRTR